jgi:hypothetical protein
MDDVVLCLALPADDDDDDKEVRTEGETIVLVPNSRAYTCTLRMTVSPYPKDKIHFEK